MHIVSQSSVTRNVEVESNSSSRVESKAASPLSPAGGDSAAEEAAPREEVKALPFKNPLYEV